MTIATNIRTARCQLGAQAAPAGGACRKTRRRGRAILAIPCLLFPMIPAAIPAAETAVPSGQPVELSETLIDATTGELWARFRFLAPWIARDQKKVGYAQAAPDMEHLCTHVALPWLTTRGHHPARIVVSLMDRPVPFGSADPDATQFFEAYRPEDGTCIWEEF